MADFTISGNMKVSTLRSKFKEEFGSTLRVYDGVKLADDDSTVASIAKKTVKRGSEMRAHGRMKVGNFEVAVKETYGIRVQVATPTNSALADNELTLSQSGK